MWSHKSKYSQLSEEEIDLYFIVLSGIQEDTVAMEAKWEKGSILWQVPSSQLLSSEYILSPAG